MKEVDIGTRKYTIVHVADEPAPDGANHEYYISRAGEDNDGIAGEFFGHICFQKGPIKEAGVNGCHHEDLIAICIHRLQSYQSGKFNCDENAIAITKLQEALHWLNYRTDDRSQRGVEGTSVP